MTYPIILPRIVIDTTNNAIRMKENATLDGTGLATVSVTPGTYVLSGDEDAGVADGDLMTAVVTAMNAHGNVTDPNTYAKTSSLVDPTAANTSGRVAFSRTTGGSSFQLLWADALTTFDAGLLGFDGTNTADSAAAKAGTLSPSGWWVSPSPYSEFEAEDEEDAYALRSRSGRVRGGSRSSTFDVRRLGFTLIDSKRTHHIHIPTDPFRALSKMLSRLRTGRGFEIHLVDLSAGVATPFLDASSQQGDAWHLSDDSAGGFRPARHSPATALYSFDFLLWGSVA